MGYHVGIKADCTKIGDRHSRNRTNDRQIFGPTALTTRLCDPKVFNTCLGNLLIRMSVCHVSVGNAIDITYTIPVLED